MDRPTTGRRRVRSGSVRVAELIRRQPATTTPPVAAAATPQPERVCAEPTETLPRIDPEPTEAPWVPEEPGEARQATAAVPADRSRVAHAAKLAGLGVAVVTLCGAIVTATVVSRDRTNQAAAGAERAPLQITGEQALLPHELDRTVTSSTVFVPSQLLDVPATGSAFGNVTPDTRPDSSMRAVKQTLPSGHRRGSDSDTSPAGSSRVPERGVTSSRELVLEYYHLVEVNPRLAFDLVAGERLGTTLAEFVGSWQTVRWIQVLDVVERPDGVLAVVRIHLGDGAHLRVQQLLKVTVSAPQRIVGAELVSAQLD
ncbi:hypothetical protein V5P93_006722 [Actinokineospora auranticolor]|uniref:Uncharacterized protein n=1 Tax=Actinokineospora auranticolor TaxID=155976 RepID=A0A2S6GWN7_9PSEU|nr:hypothetical protein [Actinokineospora auranticolor]PPK69634.1 hypothetical protein CLV40_103244 [Actinokineospora auranticolor]